MALLGALVVWPGQHVTSLLGMLCLSSVNGSESIFSYLTGRTKGLLEHEMYIELMRVSSLIFLLCTFVSQPCRQNNSYC